MARPGFSCITTVFNEGPLLAQSVGSILAQSYDDWELILVDDGSAAPTREMLASFDDPRIRVIRQANDGLSAARNRALEHANGDYVCFLDADDTRPAWALQSFARIIDREAPDVILCRGALSDTTDQLRRFYDAAIFDAIEVLVGERTLRRDDPIWDAVMRPALMAEQQSANKVVRRDLLRAERIGFPAGLVFEDIYFHANVLGTAQSLACVHSASFTYHRRMLQPQITDTAGVRRFDVIAASRLTLDRFTRTPGFDDPGARAAVLAACLKLMAWCERTISHHHRHTYRTLAAATLQLVDPAYVAALEDQPPEPAGMGEAQAYLADLLRRGAPPPPPAPAPAGSAPP